MRAYGKDHDSVVSVDPDKILPGQWPGFFCEAIN